MTNWRDLDIKGFFCIFFPGSSFFWKNTKKVRQHDGGQGEKHGISSSGEGGLVRNPWFFCRKRRTSSKKHGQRKREILFMSRIGPRNTVWVRHHVGLYDENFENQGLAMWFWRHKIDEPRNKDVISVESDIRFGRGLFQSPPKWK